MLSRASTTQFLDGENGRLAFEDTGGTGPLVLAIPGMGDLRSEYRFLNPALAEAGYRVVTMDVRGFGETSAPWPDYSARAVGRDAVAILRHIDSGPAVIAGNSFAAGSALWAAREAPDRVQGVVLLGPILRDLGTTWMQRLVLGLGFGGPWRVWFWTTYWDSLFPSRKPVDHMAAKAALAANLAEPGRIEALQIMVNLSKAETEAILDLTTVPALIVMGTKDPDFPDPKAEARLLADRLGATVLNVEGAGHYPHTEMPELVTPAILTFLAGLELGRRARPASTA